jgi:hypothetical protein
MVQAGKTITQINNSVNAVRYRATCKIFRKQTILRLPFSEIKMLRYTIVPNGTYIYIKDVATRFFSCLVLIDSNS